MLHPQTGGRCHGAGSRQTAVPVPDPSAGEEEEGTSDADRVMPPERTSPPAASVAQVAMAFRMTAAVVERRTGERCSCKGHTRHRASALPWTAAAEEAVPLGAHPPNHATEAVEADSGPGGDLLSGATWRGLAEVAPLWSATVGR